jgi:4-hydroxy-2-oxoheptanedioate aldolase
MDHPDVVSARKRVAEVARKNNKIAATPGGPGVAKNYIDMGYNLLNIGADVIALSDYAENLVSQFEEINS